MAVLVTGCSGGIGRLTALAFARSEERVFATVRRLEDAASLQAQATAEGLTLKTPILDVADRKAIDSLASELGAVDILVNNAGIAVPGAFEDTTEQTLRRIMDVNFYGPVWLTRALLPGMRARGRGRIIMVSSLSALAGLPGDAYYAASKAALEAASESLRHEVDAFGIRVSVVEPGMFDTGMPAKMAAAGAGPAESPYRPLLEHLTRRLGAHAGSGDDPRIVAEAIVAIANAESPAFRHPVGAQAKSVVAALKSVGEKEREQMIKQANDTAWWSAGAKMDENS